MMRCVRGAMDMNLVAAGCKLAPNGQQLGAESRASYTASGPAARIVAQELQAIGTAKTLPTTAELTTAFLVARGDAFLYAVHARATAVAARATCACGSRERQPSQSNGCAGKQSEAKAVAILPSYGCGKPATQQQRFDARCGGQVTGVNGRLGRLVDALDVVYPVRLGSAG
jgi:hypothetical protein